MWFLSWESHYLKAPEWQIAAKILIRSMTLIDFPSLPKAPESLEKDEGSSQFSYTNHSIKLFNIDWIAMGTSGMRDWGIRADEREREGEGRGGLTGNMWGATSLQAVNKS